MFKCNRPGHVFTIVVTFSVIGLCVEAQTDIEVEGALEKIFNPSESSLQAQSLRRDLMRRLYDALQRQELEDDLLNYKRSLASIARWNSYPGKRNIAALARGGYIKTLPDGDGEFEDKRSIANLAKNGQLPTYQQNDDKRGIEALARNGELHTQREIEELLDELYDKRNIGSIARNYNFPSYGKRYLGSLARSGNYLRGDGIKKSIASLAREGMKIEGKRNVAALLRQDKIHGPNDRSYDDDDKGDDRNHDDEKRNVGSLRASGLKTFKRSIGEDKTRGKREANYYEMGDEYAEPVYQNQNVNDYEELMKSFLGEYPNTDKRFLGSVARSGWFRQPSSSSRYSRIDKRHIGSLARLGWLPAFRTVRRFNRSGRSISECEREASADGKIQDYPFTQTQLSVNGKEYYLPPTRSLFSSRSNLNSFI